MIVAEGREIGSIWMERRSNSETTCDLGILIFDPISRGRGFGAEAIRLAEQDASAGWGVDLVRLRVRDSNQRAISCYRRCGYRISTVTLKEIDGNRIRILHMEHRLSIS
jgi:ribosomal protein S18 acetylase RimI-like enzyme